MAHSIEDEHAEQETTSRTVVGLFGDRARAEAAVRELRTAGFAEAQIGIATEASEEDTRHFDRGLRSGSVLVTVDAGARTREALALLERHGMDLGPAGAARYGRSNLLGAREPYTGRERRGCPDPAYAGPERRVAGARV
jgi:hypothetical protein